MSSEFWIYSKKLLKYSIVTGFPQIAAARSHKQRCIKVTVFLVCLFGFLYQSLQFFSVYRTYPTVVYITGELHTPIYMPAITVCSHNGVNATMFCELFPEKCVLQQDHSHLCNKSAAQCRMERHLKLVPAISAHKLPNISRYVYREMGLQLNDTFERCVIHIGDVHLKCSKQYTWVPMFDLRGLPTNCYSMNSLWKNVKGRSHRIHRKTEIVVTFKGLEEHLFYERIPRAFQMSLHDPRKLENPFINGFSVARCSDYFVYVTKVQRIYQPAPYNTNCTDYKELWYKRGGNGPLDKSMCIEECMLNASMERDHCVNPFYIVYPTDAPLCSGTINFDLTLEICDHDVCSLACDSEKLLFSVMKVKVTPDRSIELFSYIGGYLGVWLGISLVAVFDFLEFLALTIRFAVCKYKRKYPGSRKVDCKPKVPHIFNNRGFII